MYQSNILIDDVGTLVLTDYGHGRLIHCTQAFAGITTSDPTSGSIRWMAHELFDPQPSVGLDDSSSNGESKLGKSYFTKATDIWAFGMVIYVLECLLFPEIVLIMTEGNNDRTTSIS